MPPLIYASDLHRGFEPLVSDSSLAEAASIAETFLSDVSASSGETTPEEVAVVENVSDPADSAASLVEVVESGSCPSIVVDECFNQLDELNSQSSISILANCGQVAASPGGELSSSQISNVTKVENSCNVADIEGNESENTITMDL